MARTLMTWKAYAAELSEISTEIENLIIIHYTSEEINRLALEHEEIWSLLDTDALFWRTYIHCLQTTLFVTLFRIFDSHAGAHTIHSLLNATLNNIHLFSAEALRARRVAPGSPEPEWIHDLIANAWIPTSAGELRHLKTATAPYAKRYENIYRPI